MGKANRIKNEKAASTLAAPAKRPGAKKPMPTWVGTLIVVAVLVALIVIVTLSVLSSRGTFMRMHVVAETDNYEITLPMMSYMIYTEYQNLVANYDQLSEQFGTTLAIPAGKGGTALVQGTPLRDQIYSNQDDKGNPTETVTWFDRFASLACDSLTQILACCEYANEKGIVLSDEDMQEIQTSLDMIELYAAYYGYTTDGYLNSMYGRGVRLKDVRAMMELSQLAAKVSEQRADELLDGITDDRVNQKFDKDKATYEVYIDYLAHTFTATFTPSTEKDADKAAAENAQRKEDYEKKQAEYKAYADELNACTTAKEYTEKLNEILQKMYEAEEIASAEAKLAEGESLTDEQRQECKNKAQQRVVEAIKAATMENAKVDSLATKEKDWMTAKGEEARKEGDHKKFESVYDVYGNEVKEEEKKEEGDGEGADAQAEETKEYKKATSTYAVYFTTSALHRDNGVVRSVGHILFKTDTYKNVTDVSKITNLNAQTLATRILQRGAKISAEEMAKELVTLMKEEGKLTEKTGENGVKYYVISEADFEKYGNAYTEDGSVFYDDVTMGQMVEEFEDWLFADGRVVGEMSDGGVGTDYGYHVMFYKGDEKPAWSHSIRAELGEADYNEWLEALKEEHKPTFSEKDRLWNKITG